MPFLAKVPPRLKGRVSSCSPARRKSLRRRRQTTTLVAQAVDDAGFFRGFGGTAIGDAIATAVRVRPAIRRADRRLRDCVVVAAAARRVRDRRPASG